MINSKSLAVLRALVSLSGGNFKVLDASDILEKIDGEKPQKLELSGIVKSLAEQGLVKIKTVSGDTYCLQTLTRANLVLEGKDDVGLPSEPIQSDLGVPSAKAKTEDSARLRTVTVVELDKVKGLIKRAAFFGALLGGAVVGGLLIALFKIIG